MWFIPSTTAIVLLQVIAYSIQSILHDDYVDYLWATRLHGFEAWRYLSYGFIHASLLHLISNVSMTLILAPTLEFVQGSVTVAVTWLVGVILGGVTHALENTEVAVVGSSAGVYALIVVRILDIIANSENMRTWTLRLLTICCLALPGLVDWLTTERFTTTSHAAHVGGAIGGFIASIACVRNVSKRENGFTLLNYVRVFVTCGLSLCFATYVFLRLTL